MTPTSIGNKIYTACSILRTESLHLSSLACDVLPSGLEEFPVIRKNTPSREEVRKVSSILKSVFKLKLSRNKREFFLLSNTCAHAYSLSCLRMRFLLKCLLRITKWERSICASASPIL